MDDDAPPRRCLVLLDLGKYQKPGCKDIILWRGFFWWFIITGQATTRGRRIPFIWQIAAIHWFVSCILSAFMTWPVLLYNEKENKSWQKLKSETNLFWCVCFQV